MMETKKKEKDRKKQPNAFLRYTGMAVQMAVIILLGVFGGQELDKRFEMENPIFTILLSLFAVGAALYLSIKDLNR